MGHRCIVILLILAAPLSWGEDVWYCVEEHNAGIFPSDSGDAYEVQRFIKEKFTLKYEEDSNRLRFKSITWEGKEPFYMQCSGCGPIFMIASSRRKQFNMRVEDGRFFTGSAHIDSALMTTGTCTKF